jgi:hypothetical protein
MSIAIGPFLEVFYNHYCRGQKWGSKNSKLIDWKTVIWYKKRVWQRSSVVEQGTHKPLVSGPNPLVASFLFYLVRVIRYAYKYLLYLISCF